jgi:hypothetical protein
MSVEQHTQYQLILISTHKQVKTVYFGYGIPDRTMFDGVIRENNIYFRFGFNNQYRPYTGSDITNKNMILQVWVRANS